MPITPPVAGQEISATSWGIPITNEVNRMTPLLDTQNRPPCARVYRQNALSFGAGTIATITWDATDFNDFGMFVSPSDKLTVPANMGGIWLVQAHMSFAPATSGSRAIWFTVNGSSGQRIGKTEFGVVNYTADFAFTTSVLLKLGATQFVQVQYYGSAATCNVGGDATVSQCTFSMIRLGAY